MLKMFSLIQLRATLFHFFLLFFLRTQEDLWENDILHCSRLWAESLLFTSQIAIIVMSSNSNVIERWYLELHSEEHCQQVEGVDPSPLLSTGGHTWSAVFGSGFPSTRDSVQQRATKMVKRLEHLTY